jgi:hypothetical protein
MQTDVIGRRSNAAAACAADVRNHLRHPNSTEGSMVAWGATGIRATPIPALVHGNGCRLHASLLACCLQLQPRRTLPRRTLPRMPVLCRPRSASWLPLTGHSA